MVTSHDMTQNKERKINNIESEIIRLDKEYKQKKRKK